MRLTLRTLLAYLDDTLEPAEIKQIGQKVAESDAAQELIARIKQVTRRRRLTTPPATGPNAGFDANTAAEYLDSVLPSEEISEVEKICLESDVHLAEIAACHQILTLVLGEPALVPPTAKQRMYGLIQGREAVTRKAKPKVAAVAATGQQGDGSEADETLLLGLPPLGKGKNTRWLIPAAAVLLLAGLGVTLWMALPKKQPLQVAVTPPTQRERSKLPEDDKDKVPPPTEYELLAAAPREEVVQPATGNGATTQNPQKPPSPSTERRPVGKAAIIPSNTPSMVLQQRGKGEWRRLRPEIDPVYTNDPLLTLPGFRSEIRLDCKVNLVLWGNVPQQLQNVPLLESAVTLHAVSADKPDSPEVDLTLNRGRVFITNQKSEPSRVRVRFHEEVWDLTLEEKGSEIGLDLIGREGGFETGEGPLAVLGMVMLKGDAQLRIGYHHHRLQAPPGPAEVLWNNSGPGLVRPTPLQEVPPWWIMKFPATWQWDKFPIGEQKNLLTAYNDMENSLKELNTRLTDKAGLSVILAEDLAAPRSTTRELAVYSLGAISALPETLDALADEKHFDVREAAVTTLRHWLGREPGQDKKLRQALEEKRYTANQTEIIFQLLHSLSKDDLAKKQIYEVLIDYLRNDSPAIRQLAYWHLVRLVPEARKIPYDPGASAQQRAVGYEQWKKLLEEGKLPPRSFAPPKG